MADFRGKPKYLDGKPPNMGELRRIAFPEPTTPEAPVSNSPITSHRRVAIILCDANEVGEILDSIDYPYSKPKPRVVPPAAAPRIITGEVGYYPTPAPAPAFDRYYVHFDDGKGREACGRVGVRTMHKGSVTCPTCASMVAPIPVAPRPPPTGDIQRPGEAPTNFGTAEEDERIRLGKLRFDELVRTWVKNFNVEGAPQPARVEKMMATFSGMGSGNTIKHIKACGGLTTAIMDVLVEDHDPDSALSLAKEIALNMVQCGSGMAIPVQRLIEANVYLAQTHEERAAVRPSLPIMEDMENEEARPEPIKPKV